MTSDEFISVYWSQYISIEKEFTETLHYLALDTDNDDAYSDAYAKLMLQVGSEVDVVFKEYCTVIGGTNVTTYKTILDYRACVSNYSPTFISQQVSIINDNRKLQPWSEWSIPPNSLWWWRAYNKVKHSRTSVVDIDGVSKTAFKFANQKYTLMALAGLYQVLVYFYREIASAEGKSIVTPMPGSRLFKLTGGMWDYIDFYDEIAYYVDNGNFTWVHGAFHY